MFTRICLPSLTKELISEDILPGFAASLLNKSQCSQQLEYIVKLFGKSDRDASNITNEIIRDMQMATSYPPTVYDVPDETEIVQLIQELSHSLDKMKEEGSESEIFDEL